MSIVTLVSGGLDSTIMALLAKEEGLLQHPLFIDYGQLNLRKEFDACQNNFHRFGLPHPIVMQIGSYGALLSSGITDSKKHIYDDAFLPCRNLMFLVVGAAFAFQSNASAVAIGLLNESTSLFPDQTYSFIEDAQALLSKSLNRQIKISTPLMSLCKADVLKIAKELGVTGTYSCHAGTDNPCGICVACREYNGLEV
jgi:7-cyano-7-deazaguanine synthase